MNNQYLKYGFFENKYLLGAFILGTLMQIIVVIIPSFAEVFKLVPLNQTQWLYTLGISVLPLIIVQFKKKLDEIKSGKVIYQNYYSKVDVSRISNEM